MIVLAVLPLLLAPKAATKPRSAPTPKPVPTVSWSERVGTEATAAIRCHRALGVSSVECRDAASARFVLGFPAGVELPPALLGSNGATVTFRVDKVTPAGTVMGAVRYFGGIPGDGAPAGIVRASGTPVASAEEAVQQETVRRVVARSTARVRYCYQSGLAKNPALEGELTVHFTVASNGRVIDATAVDSTLHDPVTEACITTAFRAMNFPPQKAAFAANYPLRFSAVDDDGTSPPTP